MDKDFTQLLSLIVSIMVVISMIVLILLKKRGRYFYMAMIIGWLPGIIYYVGVLYFYNDFLTFFKTPAVDVSAMLRLYQYIIFGVWFTFDAIELSIGTTKLWWEKRRLKRAMKSIKDLSEKNLV